jgi:WD40 repeat protein
MTVWDLTTNEEVRRPTHDASGAVDLAFDRSGRRLAVVHGDRENGIAVRVWAAHTGRRATTWRVPPSRLYAAGPDASGRVLALAMPVVPMPVRGVALPMPRLWDVDRSRPLLTLPERLEETPAAICPHTRRFAAVASDGALTVWDGRSGEKIARLSHAPPALFSSKYRLLGVCFGAGGKLAAWCGGHTRKPEDRVLVWDVESGRLLHDLGGHADRVSHLAFDPQGRRLATVGADGRLSLWDAATGRKLWSAELGGEARNLVAFSSDGRLVAADASVRRSTLDAKVTIFDAQSGEKRRTLSGLAGGVDGLTFSPDNACIVTADQEGLRVWDAASGQELLTLPRVSGLRGLSFTPDGNRLIAFNELEVMLFDGTPLREGAAED